MRFKLTAKRREVLIDWSTKLAIAGHVLGLYQKSASGFIIGTVFWFFALGITKEEGNK